MAAPVPMGIALVLAHMAALVPMGIAPVLAHMVAPVPMDTAPAHLAADNTAALEHTVVGIDSRPLFNPFLCRLT